MNTALTAAVLLTVILASNTYAPARADAQSAGAIVWRDCGDGFECGVLKVPLDHARPREQQIEVAVARHPAAGTAGRIGPLLINPGGPGGSGIDFARFLAFALPPDVLDRFDLIGFDPRGVGASTNIDCVDDFDAFDVLDGTPDTPLELQRIIDVSRDFGADCQRRSAALIQHVDTASVARDMDLIREALGAEQITYFGVSYGTFLGATYADLFPDRLRAAVLDAAIDPSIAAETFSVQQVTFGFDRAFAAFLDDCRTDPECPFKAPDLEAAYDSLIARIEDAPLTSTERGGEIDDVDALNITLGSLYDPGIGWTVLANALRDAMEGDAFGFLVADEGAAAPEDDDGDPIDFTNGFEAFSAVACVNLLSVADEGTYRDIAATVKAASPRFGEVFAYHNLPGCAFWPRAERRIPGPITAAGAPPLLVVGTLRDPATPYEWSVALASQMESATLLTYDGDGHVAYGRDNCVSGHVDDYLLTLALPPAGTVCGGLSDAIPPERGPGLLPPDPAPAPSPPSGVIVPPDTGSGPHASTGTERGAVVAALAAAGIAMLALGTVARAIRPR